MSQPDGKNPDLRVSDAERDAVVGELGQHFQYGRLDRAEFDDRVAAALAARTQGNLDEVLTDLPGPASADPSAGRAAWPAGSPGHSWRGPRGLALLPLVLATVLIGSVLTGGWHDGWAGGWPVPFGFVWLLVPVIAIRVWIRGSRRRQWR
jgi:hypothetical protein